MLHVWRVGVCLSCPRLMMRFLCVRDPEDDPFFSDSLTFSDSPHPPPPPPPGPQIADDVINR